MAAYDDSCGWGGWMLEGAFKVKDDEIIGILAANGDVALPSVDEQNVRRAASSCFEPMRSYVWFHLKIWAVA